MPDFDLFLNQSAAEPTPDVEPAPEPTPAVETAPVEEPKGVESAPPAPELPPRGEDGRFKKSEHVVPLEALLSERERRQAAEREAQELRSKAVPAQPPVDVWENPAEFIKGQVESARAEILTEADKRAEVRARELFLSYTEADARGRYADYDNMRQVFAEEVQRNPVLISQLSSAPNPAEFIYRQGKTAAELREVGGDLSAYAKRVEAQVRAKLEREFAEKAARTAAVPQSLNSEPSRGAGMTGQTWSGPTPIEDVLPFRRD